MPYKPDPIIAKFKEMIAQQVEVELFNGEIIYGTLWAFSPSHSLTLSVKNSSDYLINWRYVVCMRKANKSTQ